MYLPFCLAALGWPLFPFAAEWAAARFDSRLFGLPFALVWTVGWVLSTFVTVGVYHVMSGGEDAA